MNRSTNFSINLLIVLMFCILLPGGVFAQSPGFKLEQVLGAPFPSSLKADPGGQQIAWVFNKSGITNIWLAEGPDFQARQMTDYNKDDGRGLRIIGFIEKGTALVFSKAGYFNPDQDPHWDGKPSLYKLNFKDRKLELIVRKSSVSICPKDGRMAYTEGGTLYIKAPGEKPIKKLPIRGRLTCGEWSPDGKYILINSGRGEFPYRYSYVVLVNVEKNTYRYIDASVYTDGLPLWSPDGKKLAFLRLLTSGYGGIITARKFPVSDPWEIRVTDLQTGITRMIWQSPPEDSISYSEISWLDNRNLVFLSEADGWRHLYSVPSSGGKARRLTSGDFIVEEFFTVPALGKIFFNSNAGDIDRRHIWSVGLNGKMRQETRGKNIQWSPVITGDKKYLAYLGSDATTPAQVYIKPLEKGRPIKLAPETLPKDFPSQLVTPRQVIFKAADGWKIHGQLFIPPKSFKGKRPALLYFHGGPVRQMLLGFHYSSYYHNGYAMNQYLASRGYVVLSVNFRLGIGYGRAFREVSDAGPRGGSEYQDLLAGAKLLRNLKYVDSNRIGLWGGSYGGLMTALGLARNSDLFAAGVDFHGVHDWNQWQAWVDNRKNDHNKTAWKSSPLADIKSWRSPVLLIHGDNDQNVPFSETIWLAEALKKQGVYHELLIFPDEVHSFLLHRNWIKAFKATVSFFDRKMPPRQ